MVSENTRQRAEQTCLGACAEALTQCSPPGAAWEPALGTGPGNEAPAPGGAWGPCLTGLQRKADCKLPEQKQQITDTGICLFIDMLSNKMQRQV